MFSSNVTGKAVRLGTVLALALAAGACASDDFRRGTGITDEAGNAIAHNTALQMVDPWPAGVDDTDLSVPHDRGEAAEKADPLVKLETTGEQ